MPAIKSKQNIDSYHKKIKQIFFFNRTKFIMFISLTSSLILGISIGYFILKQSDIESESFGNDFYSEWHTKKHQNKKRNTRILEQITFKDVCGNEEAKEDLMDEIENMSRGDSLYGKKSYTDYVNELLIQMDGFNSNDNIVVIGSTNRPELMDKAMLRSGRFDRKIRVSLPGKESRKEILKLNLVNTPCSEDVDLDELAAETILMSGADLANVTNSAKIAAAKKSKNFVCKADLEKALLDISRGLERESVRVEAAGKWRLAVNEAAFALAVALLPSAKMEIKKASIIPRGKRLVSSQEIPSNEDELYLQKRSTMLAKIDINLAGAIGEELLLGEGQSSSSSVDRLIEATKISKALSGKLGMGSELGLIANTSIDFDSLPPETRSIIDLNSIQILKESEERIKNLLRKNKTRLEQISKRLFICESVSAKEINKILNKYKED